MCHYRNKSCFYPKSADFSLLSEDICEYPFDFYLLVACNNNSFDCFIQMLFKTCIKVGKYLFSLGDISLFCSLVLLSLNLNLIVFFNQFFF